MMQASKCMKQTRCTVPPWATQAMAFDRRSAGDTEGFAQPARPAASSRHRIAKGGSLN